VRRVGQPILVHVVTTKGKGYAPAELEAQRFHGVGPFDLSTGLDVAQAPHPPTYTTVFGRTLTELAAADPRVVAITAAMLEGTGLVAVANRFPSRVYDVGIAEQHAVTFAAGMACEGFRPVVAIYSSFLQRAFDQVVHDVCLQNLPVIFCMDRSGLVGEDGPTHHGVFDSAYLRIIPNMAVMAPRDENELRHMLATAIAGNGPVAIRYPRGAGIGVPLDGPPTPLPWGKAEVLLEEGDDLALIAAGPPAHTALEAARRLAAEDSLRCTVINARFIKPLDVELLVALLARAKAVVTVEESSLSGGFGSAILELCEQHGLRPALRRLGVPDRWIAQGTIVGQHRACEIDADGVVAACRALHRAGRAQQSIAAGASDH
jgi:1-deoxy-D-xylulose-5-phosphate synthase